MPGFGTTGKVTTAIGPGDDDIRAMAAQSDGKIVVAGIANGGLFTLLMAGLLANAPATMRSTADRSVISQSRSDGASTSSPRDPNRAGNSRASCPLLPVIMISAHGDTRAAVQAVKGLKRTGRVVVVGFDSSRTLIEDLEAGVLEDLLDHLGEPAPLGFDQLAVALRLRGVLHDARGEVLRRRPHDGDRGAGRRTAGTTTAR